MVLTDLNTNVHKSVNQFLIDATDAYIRKLEGNELTNEEKVKSEVPLYITRDDLDKIRREIKDELQKEMISILASSLITGKVMQMPEVKVEREVVTLKETEDVSADDTTMGLVSSWG